jgi:hypothetical protein
MMASESVKCEGKQWIVLQPGHDPLKKHEEVLVFHNETYD